MKRSDALAAIKSLAKKSADAHDSGDAMRFAQAALNLANATICLINVNVLGTDEATQ